nr:hypothetical protein CPGR_00226 [Mycolicibacter nonchromogenicus]
MVVTNPGASSVSSWATISATASAWPAGGCAGSATWASRAAASTWATRATTSAVVATSAAPTRLRSATYSSRVHTGAGVNASVAASAQSLMSAASVPSGFALSISRVCESS